MLRYVHVSAACLLLLSASKGKAHDLLHLSVFLLTRAFLFTRLLPLFFYRDSSSLATLQLTQLAAGVIHHMVSSDRQLRENSISKQHGPSQGMRHTVL